MSRTKIMLGCTLALCLCVVSAATSYASEFRSFKGATEVKGALGEKLSAGGTQKFTIGSGVEVACTGLSGSGELVMPNPLLKFVVAYTGCSAVVSGVKVAATVTTTGCAYVFATTGEVTIECETGKSIEIKTTVCVIKVGAQKGLKKITFSPLETKSTSITGTAAVTAIKQENNCGVTGEVTYNGVAKTEATEAGVTSEIK